MRELLEGYKRFRTEGWPEQRRLYENLARNGQRPRAMVVGCIDSRVDPGRIFDSAPGEMLIVRNVANLVPPYAPDAASHGTSAALEFGVRVLEVPRIVVLGHGLCGGIHSLLNGAPLNARDFVEPWMSMAAPARDIAMAHPSEPDRQRRCEYEVVKLSLRNLATFPWIRDAAVSGKLELHGAWFDIHSGTLMTLGPNGEFSEAVENIDVV